MTLLYNNFKPGELFCIPVLINKRHKLKSLLEINVIALARITKIIGNS